MAREKGTKAGEESRKGLTDQRFTNPLDARIQKDRIEKAAKKLREEK